MNVSQNNCWYYKYMWHIFKLVLVSSSSYGFFWFYAFHQLQTCLPLLVKQFLSLHLLISPPVHRLLEGPMREVVCEQFINVKELCLQRAFVCFIIANSNFLDPRGILAQIFGGLFLLFSPFSALQIPVILAAVHSVSPTQPSCCCLLDSIFLHHDLGNALTKKAGV